MKRNWIWFLILSAITAIALILTGHFLSNLTPNLTAIQAQQLPSSPTLPEAPTEQQEVPPSPNPRPSPTPSPSPQLPTTPTPSPTASPTPSASPSPQLPTTPTISPSPTQSPTPKAFPSAPLLPLAKVPYTDTAIGYQIGILQGYQPTSIAGVTSITSPDGNLAYTVTARPRAVDNPLNEASLTQVAIETFARGEGFSAGPFEPALSGVKIPWTGHLTQSGNTQSVSGLILSRQVPGKILLLFVAATDLASEQVDSVFTTISPTLEPIN